MSPSELLALAQSYLVDKALIVVVILLMLGYFLKRTPHVPDWSIPWLLTLAGIVLACGILQAYTMENSVQGILAAGVASLTHQLWKQTTEKRGSEQ